MWRNISDRRWLDADLRQIQRLEAVGRLACGVAHDFNNFLVVILGHAEWLAKEFESGHPNRRHVEEIRSASARAAALTHQLLAFSQGRPAEVKATDFRKLVERLDPLLRRLIGEHIELDLKCEKGSSTVMADPSQLEQVIVNLAVNAQDAMLDGGHLVIAVGRRRITGTESPGESLPASDYVTLTVTDTGTGMSKEQVDRAFEPFYTTKPSGKGTGLGLATVHAVVQQCGGHAWIESELGCGTTVQVLLPLSEHDHGRGRTYA